MRRLVLLLLFVTLVSPPVIQRQLRLGAGETAALDSASRDGLRESSSRLSESSEFQVRTVAMQGAVDVATEVIVEEGPLQSFGEDLQDQIDGPLDTSDIVAADQVIQSLGIAEWLGPLAPVALSPFFGVTCLSGLSLWGPDWIDENAMIGTTSALRNPTLFYVFLGLTLLTSIPRFTKVSKPIAQAIDRLEAYSVIVILLAIKFAPVTRDAEPAAAMMVQFGVISFTADTLLAAAMIVNVLVINSVKFFFEFMVWLTPVPFLDALFELCNKSLCAALVMVYAVSPTLATVINLTLLFVAFVVIRWVGKRIRFYRTMLLDPILAWLWRPYGQAKKAELIVFPRRDVGVIPPKSRLRLTRSGEEGVAWELQETCWWRPKKTHRISDQTQACVHLGWVMNRIEFQEKGSDSFQVSFSRRYNSQQLGEIISDLGMTVSNQVPEPSRDELRYEFA